MNANELEDTLENHKRWLSDEGGTRANLRNANLRFVNLTDADLRGAYLRGANLTRADLRGANLTDADLSGADLSGANLTRADLRGANLTRADLRGAYLIDAYLIDANLTDANLTHAVLTDANLTGANLTGADLRFDDSCGVIGNMKEIKSIFLDTWPITYTAECLQIGCQRHRIGDWWTFTDDEISRMDKNALEWWGKHKAIIRQIIELSPATNSI